MQVMDASHESHVWCSKLSVPTKNTLQSIFQGVVKDIPVRITRKLLHGSFEGVIPTTNIPSHVDTDLQPQKLKEFDPDIANELYVLQAMSFAAKCRGDFRSTVDDLRLRLIYQLVASYKFKKDIFMSIVPDTYPFQYFWEYPDDSARSSAARSQRSAKNELLLLLFQEADQNNKYNYRTIYNIMDRIEDEYMSCGLDHILIPRSIVFTEWDLKQIIQQASNDGLISTQMMQDAMLLLKVLVKMEQDEQFGIKPGRILESCREIEDPWYYDKLNWRKYYQHHIHRSWVHGTL
jgi:hypothetical protein